MKKTKRTQLLKPEHYFVLVTGMPLKNLKELAYALEQMADWVFLHHVNDSRNDFYIWIHDVLGETKLGESIKEVKNQHEIQRIILKHLVDKYI